MPEFAFMIARKVMDVAFRSKSPDKAWNCTVIGILIHRAVSPYMNVLHREKRIYTVAPLRLKTFMV